VDAGLKVDQEEFATLVEQLGLPKPAPPRVRADRDHGGPSAGMPTIEAVGADALQESMELATFVNLAGKLFDKIGSMETKQERTDRRLQEMGREIRVLRGKPKTKKSVVK
jgi:hypothetical protein